MLYKYFKFFFTDFNGGLITDTVTTEITGGDGAIEAVVNDVTVPVGTYRITEASAGTDYAAIVTESIEEVNHGSVE